MDSLSKVDLTADDLQRVARAAFGSEAKIKATEECTEGWFNTIHVIELEDGRSGVLKLAPPDAVPVLRYEKKLLGTEVEVLGLLARVPRVPVPQVLYHDASRSILGQEWFLMERMKGLSLSRASATISESEKARAQRSLGRINLALNSVTGPAFGAIRTDGFRSLNWSEVLLARFADLLSDAADRQLSLPMSERIMSFVDSRKASLDRVAEPRLVHWDLHDANAFVGTDGEITGIIDPDRALWGDPLMEIYFAGFMQKSAFLEGYGNGLFLLPGARERREVYDLYLALVMVIECSFRNFTDPGHLSWTMEQLTLALAKFSA